MAGSDYQLGEQLVGRCVFWRADDRQNFGFVRVPGRTKDLFVAGRNCEAGALEPGELVRLEVGVDRKGRPEGIYVERVEQEDCA
ncbi:MAG: hypothetical protein IT177_01605 [Acidobacteria bacterium]|nr:hypothetical protein [Acidobacteriota bacterium]